VTIIGTENDAKVFLRRLRREKRDVYIELKVPIHMGFKSN